jgi:hypothetical protein
VNFRLPDSPLPALAEAHLVKAQGDSQSGSVPVDGSARRPR